MESMLPNLPTLLAIFRTSSLTAAARQLGVPRSTVSRRLSRLEQELGVLLAERNTRTFKLTDLGRRLATEAGAVVAHLQSISESICVEAGQVRGRLRVAMPPGFGGRFAARFLASFRRAHPHVDLEIVVTERSPHLLEEDFDLLLTTESTPGIPWVRRKISVDRLIAVASPAYLQENPAPQSHQELETHVLLSRGSEWQATWPRLRGAPVPVRPALITNDLHMMRGATLEGLGIALLPRHLVVDDLASGALRQILPRSIGGDIDIFVLYTAERGKSPLLRALLEGFANLDRGAVKTPQRPKRRRAES